MRDVYDYAKFFIKNGADSLQTLMMEMNNRTVKIVRAFPIWRISPCISERSVHGIISDWKR